MEPKSALEKRVVALSSKLPAITGEQAQYGYDKCLGKYGIHSRKSIFCFECGHDWKESTIVWKNKEVPVVCPGCKNKISVKPWNQPHFREMMYYALLAVESEFQVVRMFAIYKSMHKRDKATCHQVEVMQHWIGPDGKVTSLYIGVQSMSQYYDLWAQSSKLEIRSKSERERLRYQLKPCAIYPKRGISAYAKRNGFKGHFHGLSPQEFFSLILKDQYAETLIKTGQLSMFKYYADGHYKIEDYWKSIKICIRNGYIIKDASTWRDYVDLLIYFNKDLHSPKYVCPVNLDREHNKLVSKKRKIQLRQKYEEMKEEIEAAQKIYEKQKKDFFGLVFIDNNISVKVIESVKELMEEGDIHHHCVFTNEYHKRKDSLVLSATVDNVPAETVEVSLSKLDVVQARGAENKATSHNKKIIDLVRKNMHLISAIANKERKTKSKKVTIN